MIWGFSKMGDPILTMGFNTKIVIHDLDDLGVPPFIWVNSNISHISLT
jgi:hypothetical protein